MAVGASAVEGEAELETPDDPDVLTEDSRFLEELEQDDRTERLSQKAESLSGLSVRPFFCCAEGAADAPGLLICPDSPELDLW